MKQTILRVGMKILKVQLLILAHLLLPATVANAITANDLPLNAVTYKVNEEGRPHGLYEEWSPDGKGKITATFENGELRGPFSIENSTSKVWARTTGELGHNGVMTGKWTYVQRDGKVIVNSFDTAGNPTGEWQMPGKDGQIKPVSFTAGVTNLEVWSGTKLIKRLRYVNGKLDGVQWELTQQLNVPPDKAYFIRSEYANGQLHGTRDYFQGVMVVRFKAVDSLSDLPSDISHDLVARERWENGQRTGNWEIWWPAGSSRYVMMGTGIKALPIRVLQTVAYKNNKILSVSHPSLSIQTRTTLPAPIIPDGGVFDPELTAVSLVWLGTYEHRLPGAPYEKKSVPDHSVEMPPIEYFRQIPWTISGFFGQTFSVSPEGLAPEFIPTRSSLVYADVFNPVQPTAQPSVPRIEAYFPYVDVFRLTTGKREGVTRVSPLGSASTPFSLVMNFKAGVLDGPVKYLAPIPGEYFEANVVKGKVQGPVTLTSMPGVLSPTSPNWKHGFVSFLDGNPHGSGNYEFRSMGQGVESRQLYETLYENGDLKWMTKSQFQIGGGETSESLHHVAYNGLRIHGTSYLFSSTVNRASNYQSINETVSENHNGGLIKSTVIQSFSGPATAVVPAANPGAVSGKPSVELPRAYVGTKLLPGPPAQDAFYATSLSDRPIRLVVRIRAFNNRPWVAYTVDLAGKQTKTFYIHATTMASPESQIDSVIFTN